MKLVVPTDFDILDTMRDGKRQTAPNLGVLIDQDSRYMNNRLAELAANGLVEKAGPSSNSGMYVITEKGRLVLDQRDAYSHDAAETFGQYIADQLAGETLERRQKV